MGKSWNDSNRRSEHRSKWDMPHGLETDYRRKNGKRIIEEELELYEDENAWEDKKMLDDIVENAEKEEQEE